MVNHHRAKWLKQMPPKDLSQKRKQLKEDWSKSLGVPQEGRCDVFGLSGVSKCPQSNKVLVDSSPPD